MQPRARQRQAVPLAAVAAAWAAAAALLLAALAPSARAAVQAQTPHLPDALLYRLLHEEPNAQLQALGEVRRRRRCLPPSCVHPTLARPPDLHALPTTPA